MTTLIIEQGNNIEVVSNAVIQKLYETALNSTNVTLSGNLQCEHCYEDVYNYLTGYITEGVKRFPDLAINVTGGTYIKFADPEVERVLLSLTGNYAISSDGIGITQTDATVPTKTPQELFNNNTTITSFNELGKFTNLKWLQTQAFSSATNLTSVDLSNIERIDFMAFADTKLTGVVNLPSLVKFGGRHAFTRCNYITEVNIGPNFTGFGNVSTFEGCTALTKVTGLNNLTEISGSTFEGCTALSDIDVDWNKITKLNDRVFYGCSSLPLTNLSIPNLTSLDASAFRGCTGLTSIDLSQSSIAVVSRQVFENCNNLSKLKFPSTAINLNSLWCNNIASTLYITGLDNINTHSEYNWQIMNKNIQNPIKDSLSTGGAIVCNKYNNTVTSIHSLYEPTRVNTPIGNREQSFNVNGWLVYASGGSAMVNIGLLYLRDISSFGYVTFYRCNITNLVINNTTPPMHSTNSDQSSDAYYTSWGNSIFGDQTSSDLGSKAFIGTLWVPDSAVATYQADPQYSGLTIKGINTKTNGVDYDLPRYADFSAWEAAEEAAVAQGGHASQGLIESWM